MCCAMCEVLFWLRNKAHLRRPQDTEAPAAGVLKVESVMQMGELVMRMTTAAQQAYSSALAPNIRPSPAQEEPKPEGHGDAMDTE